MNQRFCILATALLASVLLSGCFATSSEQKYGALGGAAGAGDGVVRSVCQASSLREFVNTRGIVMQNHPL